MYAGVREAAAAAEGEAHTSTILLTPSRSSWLAMPERSTVREDQKLTCETESWILRWVWVQISGQDQGQGWRQG